MANTFNADQMPKKSFTTRAGEKIVSPFYTWEVTDAKGLLQQNHDILVGLKSRVDAELTAGNLVTDELKTEFNDAARAYNRSLKGVKYATHGVGATAEGMFKSIADAVGIDTSKWGSVKIKGDLEQMTENALKSERTLIGRVASKPFRLAADSPRVALALGSLLAVAGIGEALHKRAERRTEVDAMQQAAMIQAQIQAQQAQAPMAQATTTHVPVPAQFPVAGSAMNAAPSQIIAGNDNAAHMGTVVGQERLASL